MLPGGTCDDHDDDDDHDNDVDAACSNMLELVAVLAQDVG